MDIKPKLTPKQEYALNRISEIIRTHHATTRQRNASKCCYKMALSAFAMLIGVASMPLELQEQLHFIHTRATTTQYASPIEIEDNRNIYSSQNTIQKQNKHNEHLNKKEEAENHIPLI